MDLNTILYLSKGYNGSRRFKQPLASIGQQTKIDIESIFQWLKLYFDHLHNKMLPLVK